VGAIVLFCAMAGFLTPLLVDSWSSGDPDRAGTAYAVNIAGSIIGPMVAGFWLLPWLGERLSIMALAIPLFAVAALTVFRKPSEPAQVKSSLKPKIYLALAVIAAILLLSVSQDFETRYAVREVKRDYTATVIATGTGPDRNLLVNGVGMTAITPITKYIAHLPLAFMARRPQNGLVICFGMGTSFRSMLTWDIPTTTVDLIPSVPAMFGYYHADAAKVLSSPLARIVIDDGRRFLDGSTETYDVIVIDPPPPPQAAGSSLLYSREFYEVIKKHLQKDGILQTWYPEILGDTATSVSVTKALMQSFPYVRAFRSFDKFGIHYLASMEPIPITPSSVLAERMPPSAASDFVEWGPQATAQQQFELVLSRELALGNLVANDPRVPVMRDDQPINEYYLLRSWFHSYR
jgi:predicted membrane-bound spermidine synthase